MRPPPPLTEAHRYPVVSALGAAALAATIAWWCKRDIQPLVMSARFWPGEPWRLVTSTWPHANVLHLAFNLYWLWVFGTLVEGALGSLKTLGILLLFAAGSSAAEYAFLHGGVGLSGVGYGLFGLLWVLSRKDQRFFGAVDRGTVQVFVVWFFLCLALTALKMMAVANIAHGTGATLGLLLGHALSGRESRRRASLAAAVALAALSVAAAGPGRPFVNLAGAAAEDLARDGTAALEQGDNERGAALLLKSLALNRQDARTWYNLGVAYSRLGREDEAGQAFESALALNPGEELMRANLARWKGHAAWQAQTAGRWADAARGYEAALSLDRRNAPLWQNLALCYEQLGRLAEAVRAQEQAAQLSRTPETTKELERLRGLLPAK